MGRLERRVVKLEGGNTDQVTVVASVPPGWSPERQERAAPDLSHDEVESLLGVKSTKSLRDRWAALL
jgi:hypothetical protein